ncbi:preprotein translocase subunit TatB, partial [Oxalobacteraceae bacterium OM1]
LAASLVLGTLFGLIPVLTQFFGIPVEIRYGPLAAGKLTAAAVADGEIWRDPAFWLAFAGVAGATAVNIATSLICTVVLALRVRGMPARIRSRVYLVLARGLCGRPRYFLLPERDGATDKPLPVPEAAVTRAGEERRAGGGRR